LTQRPGIRLEIRDSGIPPERSGSGNPPAIRRVQGPRRWHRLTRAPRPSPRAEQRIFRAIKEAPWSNCAAKANPPPRIWNRRAIPRTGSAAPLPTATRPTTRRPRPHHLHPPIQNNPHLLRSRMMSRRALPAPLPRKKQRHQPLHVLLLTNGQSRRRHTLRRNGKKILSPRQVRMPRRRVRKNPRPNAGHPVNSRFPLSGFLIQMLKNNPRPDYRLQPPNVPPINSESPV